jgi:MFS family permease
LERAYFSIPTLIKSLPPAGLNCSKPTYKGTMSTTTETLTAIELTEIHPAPKTAPQRLSKHPSMTSLEPLSTTTQNPEASSPPPLPQSNLHLILTIATPSLVGFLASFTNGLITVGLPPIASSLALPRTLYLWPASVIGLTSGAFLLIAGSIADIVGARPVEIVGIALLGLMALACGFAQTGAQLVAFRAVQGIALAMHLPASVAIIARAVPSGRKRNLGFACLGFSQPLGFAVGLVLSGVLIEKVGWRSGFYLSGGCTLAVAVAAVWTLPDLNAEPRVGAKEMLMKVGKDIDWIGGLISSGGLAMLAYVLAILSADLTQIHTPLTATLLTLSLILLLAFPLWIHHRTLHSKPALIPNALWRNTPFSSTCAMVALSYGVVNAIELFSSLYFQEIQHASTLTTSLYLLPNLTTGVLTNIAVGAFVHKVSARWLIAGSALICALSPLGMALMDPSWKYWYLAFWAQVCAPVSADVLFTVGLIIVSDNFPEDMQGLAGAVFSTVAQFGMSLGVGSAQVVALGVQSQVGGSASGSGGHGGDGVGNGDDKALLRGYRAGFWLMFAYMVACGGIAILGLRKAGRVGLKRE